MTYPSQVFSSRTPGASRKTSALSISTALRLRGGGGSGKSKSVSDDKISELIAEKLAEATSGLRKEISDLQQELSKRQNQTGSGSGTAAGNQPQKPDRSFPTIADWSDPKVWEAAINVWCNTQKVSIPTHDIAFFYYELKVSGDIVHYLFEVEGIASLEDM